MKDTFYRIDSKEWGRTFYIFFELTDAPGRKLKVRPEYRDLACSKCGKFDEMEALLKRGAVPGAVPAPLLGDALLSYDGVMLVSEHMKETLLSVPNLQCHFAPIPDQIGWFALWPHQTFFPPADIRIVHGMERIEGEPFRAIGNPCRKCGRFRVVTYWPDWLSIPRSTIFAGVLTETSEVTSVGWIANQEVVDQLQQARLKGWRLVGKPLSSKADTNNADL